MKTTFQIESETGGFLLFDPSVIPYLGEGFEEGLNILFDPAGQTCVVEDFPDQEWAEVWNNTAQYFQTFPRHRQIFLALAQEGTLFIRLQDMPLTAEEERHILETYSGSIQVTGKRLAVIDGMMFFEEGTVSRKETVSLSNGFYSFTIYHLKRHPDFHKAVGVFGFKEWPTVIVVLKKSNTAEDLSNIIQLDTQDWIVEPVMGALCIATVTKVEAGVASLSLHLTQSTRSGYGRLTIPKGKSIKANQDIVVQLEQDTGPYWLVQIVIGMV